MSDSSRLSSLTRRNLLQAGAALGLAAATGSLGSPAAAQTPVRGGQLRLGLDGGASADTLEPALASASVNFVIAHCWGDTLVESDPTTGAAGPSLAESWFPSADAKEWTFKIRKDVRFSRW